MNKKIFLVTGFLVTILLLRINAFSQAATTPSVKGRVVDAISLSPLSHASIRIIKPDGNKLVNGGLSNDSGYFSVQLPTGKYFAEIEFMGYTKFRSKEFSLATTGTVHDLGTISLQPISGILDEVIVQAEKSSMQLSLDKKVFNVGKDLANAGGTASDILTNIPSVSVDAEGGVKLRGSDNVRILIDGKPSGMVSIKGGSGLQQLQASMVERVEIITNPSARYEAEGMAGIINIVLKKETKQGFNGTVELVTGTPTNLGAAFNLNYRHRKINFFLNYGIAYRKQPYRGSQYQEVYGTDTVSILKQTNNGTFTGFNNNIRGGLDYYFTEKSILTASYLNRRSKGNRLTNIRYEDYLNSLSDLKGISLRTQDEDETEPNSEYSLNFKQTLPGKGHELVAELKYLNYWENSDQLFTQRFFQPNGTENAGKALLEKSLNDEYEDQWLFQVDYTKPIAAEGKFETGFRSSFRDMVNDYLVTRQGSGGSFEPVPGLDNIFDYNENILAAYGILGNKTKRLSYQGGLRAEWTDVTTTLRKTAEVNPRKYMNVFPSAHLSVDLEKENAIQFSYSRRVRRPFYNDLSPYVTFSDSRNFFSGNPDLDPEYSNLMELGHLKTFDKGSFTSAIYYRNTKDKIDRIRTVDAEGNAITKPQNLQSENAMGLEFTGGYNPRQWWKMDLNLNFFYSDIDGTNLLPDFRASTYSWFARQTSRFILPRNLDIQVRTNYEAPQKTVQGRRKGMFFADISFSKDILKERGTINLNIMDVFNSRRTRTVNRGDNFYTEGDFQFRRRQLNLSFSYRIRQTKQAAKARKTELPE
ncbi:TonB-dependent receptor domain-containing protein [Flavihumibacter stibioxidans]|uniref:TonB-dependent receptor n=1 Tax=Flavihumibacter stibioxidans TaxID=1834163 RepID=A0ABR7M6P6_9BACT|nr:TonB-dependent receptor [Flavihumibacter stibioxidans]MBC6490586.1 TonB-dependent receptor [Flavihumibacter stibioxidans]